MSVSSPTSSWGPRSSLSMSRSGGTHESSDTQFGAYTASSASGNGGAPLCDASRTVAEGSSADAARSSATRQGHSSSAVADARSGDCGRGDVGESPPGMKDGRKGKARAKEGAPSSSSGTRAPQSNPLGRRLGRRRRNELGTRSVGTSSSASVHTRCVCERSRLGRYRSRQK